MDKKIINDIADKLEDIKNDTITEAKEKARSIDQLIKELQAEKKKGIKKVYIDGTLFVRPRGEKSDDVSLIFSNESYRWF